MWGFQPLLVTASVDVNIPATLDVGTFTLNGQTASVPLIAGTGSFALSGQAIGLLPLIASSGSFFINGRVLDVTIEGFASGSFALTGQDLGLPTYRLTAEMGKFYSAGRAFNQPIAASSAVKIITLGDSIFQYANFTQSATRIDNQADGELFWVKQRGKAGFLHDNWYAADAIWIIPSAKPLFKGANHGWGGDWALGVLRRLTAVINMNPDIVVLNIGTNFGLDPGTDAASVISQLGQIVAALAGIAKPNGSGIIRLVIGTIRPRAITATASSGLYTYEMPPSNVTRRDAINAYIRTLDNGSTIFLWDPESDLQDPNPTAPLLAGSIYRWATRDGVHLAPRGAYASSRTLELTIDRVLGDGTAFDADATVSNAITNGVLTGTGGTVSGVTGQAPNNTTVQIVNGATAFVSGVSSVVAGGWQFDITCTGGSSSASNVNVIRAESANITFASQGWTAGTWVKAYAEVEVSNQQALGALHLDLLTGTTVRGQSNGPTISNRAAEAFADGGWSGWFETSAQQVGALDTTAKARIDIEPYIDRGGDATVTIKRWIIRSVTDPHTIFPFDPMNPVSIALTGQPITFNLAGTHASLIADTGLFLPPIAGLSGQVAILLRQLRLTAGDGTFVVLGGGSSPLVDEQGAFLIDEQGAVLIVQDSEAVTFTITKSIIADFRLFLLTGIDADFPLTLPGIYNSSAEKLDLFLNGQDVTLAKHTLATLDVGEFLVTADDIEVPYNRIPLTADFGDFILAVQTASFPTPKLDAETGLFTLSTLLSGATFLVIRRIIHVRFGPLLRAPRRIYPGDVVSINGTFYDEEEGLPFDPLTVTLRIVGPFGPLRSYTYGSDVELRKTADGRYAFDLTLDAPGRWSYQWVVLAGGDITSVKQGSLSVQDTPFYQFPRQRYTG